MKVTLRCVYLEGLRTILGIPIPYIQRDGGIVIGSKFKPDWITFLMKTTTIPNIIYHNSPTGAGLSMIEEGFRRMGGGE